MYTFGEFSDESCYIWCNETGKVVDTFFIKTLSTFTGKDLSFYGLSY